jgi:hypothetical protein
MSYYGIRNGIGWSVPKELRGYQPPPRPPAAFQPPAVTAPSAPAKGTAPQNAYAAMTNGFKHLEDHLTAVDAMREHFTPEGAKAQLATFSETAAAKAVDATTDVVRRRHEEAVARVENVKKALSPAGNHVAAELRNTRTWGAHGADP